MEQMYRYIKGHEKRLPWYAVPADDEEKLQPETTGFVTVLACTEKVRKGTSVSENAKYVGPFYLDIDDDSIKASIKSAKATLKKLQKFGVVDNAIKIWATGKRGFHFLIEMGYFAKAEPTAKLGYIYKLMASQMKLPDNVDMSVYSGGKGRMWRIENKKRIDNGKFKVPITPDELREMTAELYDEYTSEPRQILEAKPFTGTLPILSAMFRLAKSKADEIQAPQAVFLDPEIIEQMDGALTPCGEMMRTGTDLKAKLGFNAVSMQFGKAVAAFSPDNARTLIEEFAENYPGESYDTVKKRRDHTTVVFRTATRDSTYKWSCRSALSILKTEPCENCPIVHLRFADEQEEDDIENDALPIFDPQTRTYVPQGGHGKVNGHPAEVPVNGKSNGHHYEGVVEVRADAIEIKEIPESRATPQAAAPVTGVVDLDDPNAVVPIIQRVKPNKGYVDLDDPDAVVPVIKMLSKEERAAAKLAAAAQKIADAGAGLAVNSAKPLPPRTEAATPPAGSPPEKKPKKKAERPTELDPDNDVGLLTTEKGYSFLAGEGLRAISNFTLLIHKYYTEWVPNLNEDRRVAVAAKVFVDNAAVGTIIIEENNWGARSAFNNCLSGLSNAAFFGKDDDVIKMKTALMSKISETAEHVRRVGSIGVHRISVAGQNLMTYVEPGWSIDNFGYKDKYYFNDRLEGAPSLFHESDMKPGDMMAEVALRCLMGTNEPVAVAQMFSWFMACFIKEHCKAYRKEFPLLGLQGNRGSGKTKGAEVMSLLHGYPAERAGLITNLPMVSPFAIWKTLATTTTFPVICDEYNASKMKREKYNDLGEIFKESYQFGSVKRGTLSKNTGAGSSASGAHVIEFELSAPIVVCSEQGVTMPALVQRMVQVPLTPASLRLPRVTENYRYVIKHTDDLRRFAKAAYMHAIGLDPLVVEEWLTEYGEVVSLDIGDRPQHSFCILLAGLRFFEELCTKYELNLQPEIDSMRATLLRYLKTEHLSITESKNRSEIDIILEKIAAMASIEDSDSSNQSLRLLEDIHYIADGNNLYLNAPICYMQYQTYCNRVEHTQPVITDYLSFRNLLQNEAYTISISALKPGFARDRPVVQLDMEKMSLKGIDVSSFLPSGYGL